MAIPQDWWKDPSRWTDLRFNVSDFAAARQRPTYQNMVASGMSTQPWNYGDSYVGVQNNPDNNALDFMPTPWGQSPLMSMSNAESNFRFEFDDQGNVIGGIAKIGDKVGQKFTTSIGEDGAVSLIPTEQVDWDTGNRFQNMGLLGVAGTAALGATGATMFPGPQPGLAGAAELASMGPEFATLAGTGSAPGGLGALDVFANSASLFPGDIAGEAGAAAGNWNPASLFAGDIAGEAGAVGAGSGALYGVGPAAGAAGAASGLGGAASGAAGATGAATGLQKLLEEAGIPWDAAKALFGLGAAGLSAWDANRNNNQTTGFQPSIDFLSNHMKNPNWYQPQFTTTIPNLPPVGRR